MRYEVVTVLKATLASWKMHERLEFTCDIRR